MIYHLEMISNKFSWIIIYILHASYYLPATNAVELVCDIQSRNFPKPIYFHGFTRLDEKADQGEDHITVIITFDLNYKRSAEGIIGIDSMQMKGVMSQNGQVQNVNMNFEALSSFRYQHTLRFFNTPDGPFIDHCDMGFVAIVGSNMDLDESVKTEIIDMAETCLEDYFCRTELTMDAHRLGNEYYFLGRSFYKPSGITTQSDVNAILDFVVFRIINNLIEANTTVISIGALDTSNFLLSVKAENGYVDAITHLERLADFKFYHAAYQYTFETKYGFKGGKLQFDGFEAKSTIKDFRGTLILNLTDSKLDMKVTIDYNSNPCEVHVTKCQFEESENFLNLSKLTTKTWIGEVPAEFLLSPLKPAIIEFLRNLISNTIKDEIMKIGCQEYRDIVYEDARNVFREHGVSISITPPE